MIKKIGNTLSALSISISIFATILAIIQFVERRRFLPGSYARHIYWSQMLILLTIVALAIVIAIGARKLANEFDLQLDFLNKNRRKMEKSIEEMQNEITTMQSKLSDIRKVAQT